MENPCLLSLYSTYWFKILTRESLGKNLSVASLTILLRRLIPEIIAHKIGEFLDGGEFLPSAEVDGGLFLLGRWRS